MTTVILGLGALTIVMGCMLVVKDKELFKVKCDNWELEETLCLERICHELDVREHEEKFDSLKQTSSAWILEKEEIIEKLERDKFNQLHELALMLNDSYYVDEVILEKAEKFDWLVNGASRKQKRDFINGCIIK